MKKSLLLILFLFSFLTQAQNFSGDWFGTLKLPGTKLEVVFHITNTDGNWSATMDSPMQNAFGIPLDQVLVNENKISLSFTQMNFNYSGELQKDETIVGHFRQGNLNLDLVMSRTKEAPYKRPQEPKAPFDYIEREVSIVNSADNVTLSGTLTLPKTGKNFPVAILISGSGPQNRDEEILGHKPFLVIADYLTKKGIAVLRYDDRGVGKSTGDFATATSQDFAKDTEAIVNFIKSVPELNHKKISLIGHSEGGMIAQIVASRNKNIHNIVFLAAPGINGDEILMTQTKLHSELQGFPDNEVAEMSKTNRKIYDIFLKSKNFEEVKQNLKPIYTELITAQAPVSNIPETEIPNAVENEINQIATPWLHYFINYKPADYIAKIKCPILILNGEKDFQVEPISNTKGIENALKNAGNKNFKTIIFPKLNHLFQTSVTGDASEYETIEETISLQVLNEISNWLKL